MAETSVGHEIREHLYNTALYGRIPNTNRKLQQEAVFETKTNVI